MNAAGYNFRLHGPEPAPGFHEPPDIGHDLYVDLETRVFEAHVDYAIVVDEPEAFELARQAAELELYYRTAGRHGIGVQAGTHAPREKRGIQVLELHVAGPALAPGRELHDDAGAE